MSFEENTDCAVYKERSQRDMMDVRVSLCKVSVFFPDFSQNLSQISVKIWNNFYENPLVAAAVFCAEGQTEGQSWRS